MVTNFKIFEYIKNQKLMNYYLEDTLSKIEKWSVKNLIKYGFQTSSMWPDESIIFAKVRLYDENKKDFKIKLKKYLDSLKRNLLNHNIIFSYVFGNDWPESLVTLKIYLKNIKIKRVKPDKYLYHSSSNKFRDSILENGLLPKYSGTWSYDLEYPPAVFAINGVDSKGNEYWFPHSKDIWRINTKKLPNQWWSDLNLGSDRGHIMTFDSIPPKYLKLYKKHDN